MQSSMPKMTIAPFRGRVRIITSGFMIADTNSALELVENGCANVYYIPKSDIEMNLLDLSETTSICPHKGTASYWTIAADGDCVADAAWSYEDPLPGAEAISGYLAFAPDKVAAIESTSSEPAR